MFSSGPTLIQNMHSLHPRWGDNSLKLTIVTAVAY